MFASWSHGCFFFIFSMFFPWDSPIRSASRKPGGVSASRTSRPKPEGPSRSVPKPWGNPTLGEDGSGWSNNQWGFL